MNKLVILILDTNMQLIKRVTGIVFLMLQLTTTSTVSCGGASGGLKLAPHYMQYCSDVSKG